MPDSVQFKRFAVIEVRFCGVLFCRIFNYFLISLYLTFLHHYRSPCILNWPVISRKQREVDLINTLGPIYAYKYISPVNHW